MCDGSESSSLYEDVCWQPARDRPGTSFLRMYTYQANVTDSRQTELRPPRLTSIARPNYEHSTTANICILD